VTSSSAPSWPDALAAAETMTAWARRRSAQADDWPGPDAVQLLARALWRTAADHDVPVADAVLNDVLLYLRRPERMLAEPRPRDADPLPSIENRADPALQHAELIWDANQIQHRPSRDLSDLGNTDDGMLDPRTIGERLTEIAQDPKGQPPLPETETVNARAAAAGHALNRREWVPTTAECTVAAAAEGALRAFSTEPLNAFDFSWLARLRRLAHAGRVLRELAEQHRSGVSPLLTDLLVATADLLDVVTEPVAGLESAWSARPAQQRLPSWEQRHLPLGLRARVVDADHLASFVVGSTLVAAYTGDVDY
jgi:hypothetical protein